MQRVSLNENASDESEAFSFKVAELAEVHFGSAQ